MKVLLIGQPNVGKSSLLNALTGAKVVTSNYPGTTVDITKGKADINGKECTFIDTPGTYSLTPSSEEEKVTDRMVLEGNYDFIIQVADATAPERSLIMALQLAELKVPFIMALNFYEDAEKKGARIDVPLLKEIVGVPIVRVNPVKKKLAELIKILDGSRKSRFRIAYDDHIEAAIEEVEKVIDGSRKFSKRGMTVKLLEGDMVAWELFGKNDLKKIIRKYKKFHPAIEKDIMITRAGHATMIAEKSFKMRSTQSNRLSWLDDFIINDPIGGTVFVLTIFVVIFTTLFYIGGWFQDILGNWFYDILNSLQPWIATQNPFVSMLVENSLIGLTVGISVAVPYVGIFYFLLALMEDSGILSRFIVALNRIMEHLGLPGKAIIPMMLGLGCSVPAIKATRILPNFKDRLKVAVLYMSIPCSSRSAIIFGVVGHYAGFWYAVGIYLSAFFVLVITARLLNIVIKKEPFPLIEELPPYRMPLLKNLLLKSWIRVRDFVYIVIPLLIVGGMIYGSLLYLDLVHLLASPLRPLTVSWLGLPEGTAIPLIYGFLQKDLVPAMLASSLGTANFASVMTKNQLFTFGLASTLQTPCIIALGMLVKEFGYKRALTIEVSTFVHGILWAGIIGYFVAIFIS